MNTQVQAYRLRLTHPLCTARTVMVHRSGFVLHVRDGDGRHGAGDAAPWPGFGSPPEAVERAVHAAAEHLRTLPDVAAAQRWLDQADLPVEVAHAVDLALLDLQAQGAGVPLARYLNADAAAEVPVHVLVRDAMSAKDAVKAGAQVLKLKLGRRTLDEDVTHVSAVRAAVGDAVALRLDANGAWPLSVAHRAVKLLCSVSPEWLEQPVAADDIAGLRQLRSMGMVPIAADEAAQSATGLQAVLQAEAADVVVLKPMFMGGLRVTQRHAAAVAERGVRYVVTHALESAVGRSGAAHMAAALGGHTAGLANPLAEDVATAPGLDGARWRLPAAAGLGLTWQEPA